MELELILEHEQFPDWASAGRLSIRISRSRVAATVT
jgi:hypothetical protein